MRYSYFDESDKGAQSLGERQTLLGMGTGVWVSRRRWAIHRDEHADADLTSLDM